MPEKDKKQEESSSLVKNSALYREFLAEREEILRHKWLESERAGHDIGFEKALLDWIVKFRSSWREKRARPTVSASHDPTRKVGSDFHRPIREVVSDLDKRIREVETTLYEPIDVAIYLEPDQESPKAHQIVQACVQFAEALGYVAISDSGPR